MLALWLALALGGDPAAPTPLAPPAVTDDTPVASDAMRTLSRFGLDKLDCGDRGCLATEAGLGIGAGGSNFGGFALGYEVHGAVVATRGSWGLQGALASWGHFDGLGQQTTAKARPAAGELAGQLDLGVGRLPGNALRGGGGLVLLLDAASMTAGVLDSADLVAFTPNLAVGYLAHSATSGASVEALLHAGGDGFFGDGLLSHSGAGGGGTGGWTFDPYFAADLRVDLPLSPTAMLRLQGELSATPDWLSGSERTLLLGRFEGLARLGPVHTGPMLTVFSPERQLQGGGVTGAAPETSFLWMIGF